MRKVQITTSTGYGCTPVRRAKIERQVTQNTCKGVTNLGFSKTASSISVNSLERMIRHYLLNIN